jgi:type II secretory pathway pseudopilin PulG
MKKGAMFGLDARIALAIFGALSVISGAALYSAIEKANTEKWRQYFEELIKASEAYYLDNGKQIENSSTANFTAHIEDLSKNRESLTTWKGPYWSTIYTGLANLQDSTTSAFHSNAYTVLYLRTRSDWAEMNDVTADGFCAVGSSDCAEWIGLFAGASEKTSQLQQIFTNLDDSIDNGDGALSGKVRYNTYSVGIIMYQGLPRVRR